jgi:hypothetical protein
MTFGVTVAAKDQRSKAQDIAKCPFWQVLTNQPSNYPNAVHDESMYRRQKREGIIKLWDYNNLQEVASKFQQAKFGS